MQDINHGLGSLPIATTRVPPRLPFTYYDALLVLMAVFWGTNFVVLKAATTQIPASVFNLVRFAVGTISIGVILYFNRHTVGTLALPRREWGTIFKCAFISSIAFQTLFVAGLQRTTSANSSLIITFAPVMLVLLNSIRGKDRIGRGGIIGSLLAFAGVSLVIFYSHAGDVSLGGATLAGDALTFGAAFVWVWNVLATKDPLERLPVLVFSFWHGVVMTCLQLLVTTPDLVSFEWTHLTMPVLLMAVYSGLGPYCIASLIWNRGIQTTGTTRIAIYANLQPIIAAVTGALFLGEPFTSVMLIGAVLVLVGVVLVKRG